MSVDLAHQLESIFHSEPEVSGLLGHLAAAPLAEPTAGRIRRAVANASPAVRLAKHRQLIRMHENASDSAGDSPCGADHQGLVSFSRMVDRSPEQWGAQT
ncbi:hypothetical protein MWU57_08045 [Isoptericola sp. S6320L]|uniref:hypothetical protein n=1 Tax=Isoptericola sp. S6320L TaxID=2926411 RepID=UPI001FF23EE0|nr:hypothetical protein [Isoptericola sp. S6320L]MCK0116985.1 hypothetical protein [Isoptericola sp. S6320L]